MTEPVSERAKAALREIGLTQYETRAYLHLIEKGATTASRISENTDVPYSKMYEVLDSLEKKGWIETKPGRPKTYYPKPPAEALEAARLRIENTMKAWSRSVIDELQPLYQKREIREKPDVWILRGEFDAIAKLKDVISNARTELMVAVPPLTKPLLNAVLPMLKSLPETRVGFFLMVSRDQRETLGTLSRTGEVRVKDNMFGGGIIADGREALLILGEEKPSLIIWSDHLGLVKFARDYFQHLWNTAEKV